MTPRDLDPARRRPAASGRSLLWSLNTALARPLAALFAMLGFGAGQLSLQAVTVTLVGLLRLASGEWAHAVQGALIVYGGLLLDRADWLLAQRRPPAEWTRLLGQVADRVVEAGLVVGLAVLATTGLAGLPGPLAGAWAPFAGRWTLALAVAAAASLLLARLAQAYADLAHLRSHLLSSRRLPGPAAIPRGPQRQARLSTWLDRDALVLAWGAGVVLGQVQVAALALLLAGLALLAETLVLSWQGRRDPEPHASRVLAAES